MNISEIQSQIHKKGFLFEINAFEVVVRKSAYSDENTCHRESTCEQTVWRFQMWLRLTSSNSIISISLKSSKIVVPCWLQQCFEPVNTLITEWCAEARPFRRLSKNRKIVVPLWLPQCFEHVNTLITEWCAEVKPFRHLSKHLFRMQ